MHTNTCPHLRAVEHPDLVESLLGCHGASEGHPQAVASSEVTSLAASWFFSHEPNLCRCPSKLNIATVPTLARCRGAPSKMQKWTVALVVVAETFRRLFHGGGELCGPTKVSVQPGLCLHSFGSSRRTRGSSQQRYQ